MTDVDDRQVEPDAATEEGWERGVVGEEADVLLDVPELRVDEISLEVEDLHARVSLEADVLQLLKLHVGVDAELGRVQLTIKGVEAKVLLKVHLDNVARILDRVLTTIDNNPDIVERLTEHVGQAVEGVGAGAGQAVGDLGTSAGSAVADVAEGARAAVEDVGESAGTAVEDFSDEVSDADDEAAPSRDEDARPRRRRRESTTGRSRKAPRGSRGRGREGS